MIQLLDVDRDVELDEQFSKHIDAGRFYTVKELAEDLKRILHDNVSLEVSEVGSHQTSTKQK